MVELTGETYYHSVAGLFNSGREEFKEQALMHAERIQALFGLRPAIFRNTECMYNDGIAQSVQEAGFDGIMTEGVDWLMAERGRSSDFVYRAPSGIPVLLRNYRLSDDIGYRFSNTGWDAWPLSAETFASWLAEARDMNIFLAMDYEAIGEHIAEETGIFEFLRTLPGAVSKYPQLSFTTPGEAIRALPVAGEIHVDDFRTISWADAERDTSAWLGNEMQQACFDELKAMEGPVKQAAWPELLDTWRRLLTSDHLYYLATKSADDQDVHRYFSAYGSAVEAFVRYYAAIANLARRSSTG
jgi:alpha-amylase